MPGMSLTCCRLLRTTVKVTYNFFSIVARVCVLRIMLVFSADGLQEFFLRTEEKKESVVRRLGSRVENTSSVG